MARSIAGDYPERRVRIGDPLRSGIRLQNAESARCLQLQSTSSHLADRQAFFPCRTLARSQFPIDIDGCAKLPHLFE